MNAQSQKTVYRAGWEMLKLLSIFGKTTKFQPSWSSFQLLENSRGTREMTQQLRVLAALPEGLVLIPSTHIAVHSHLQLQCQGICSPPWVSMSTRHTHEALTYLRQNIHTLLKEDEEGEGRGG